MFFFGMKLVDFTRPQHDGFNAPVTKIPGIERKIAGDRLCLAKPGIRTRREAMS